MWRPSLCIRAAILAALLPIAAPASAHPPLDQDLIRATRRIGTTQDLAGELLARGELRRLAGDFEGAEADYLRAATLDARRPEIALCRAALFLDQGRQGQALKTLDRLLADHPDRTAALLMRARIAENQSRPLDAAADLTRAIEHLDPPSPDHYIWRARLLAQAGPQYLGQALKGLDEGTSRLGVLAALDLYAIELERARGTFDGALARLDRLARHLPRPEALLARRAELLAGGGGKQAALWTQAAAQASTRSTTERQWRAGAPAGRILERVGEPVRIAGLPGPPTSAATAAALPAGQRRTRSSATTAVVSRGPYLQQGRPDGVTIRWRSDQLVDSRVRYGTVLGSPDQVADDPAPKTEHEIVLTGLAPETRYYYSVGTTTAVLAGGDAGHSFVTAPPPGSARATRLWIVGDSGTANSSAAAVRDAFATWTASRPADLWLMLGDNAYGIGTDAEYQAAVFDMYPALLRTTVLWPTRGNHDLIHAGPNNDYYDIFTLPTSGEAGGLPSGTEAYYSFDYANIHFICLDSEGSDRTRGGAMAVWLRADLDATTRDWVIAYWHHPPYTKGSHDSDNVLDSGGRMQDMRQNILPILDSAGVDVVLTGHSHSYERSFLLNGHYGPSPTLTPFMKVDDGDGRWDGDGAYMKPTLGTGHFEGCVYAVAGSSGQISGGTLDHPVMISSLNLLGSMVVDVQDRRLDARFLDGQGVARDSFTIMKGTVVGVKERSTGEPEIAVSPNPGAGRIRIAYRLAAPAHARVVVLDVLGRRVRTLGDDFQAAGDHDAVWDGRDAQGGRAAAGVYFAVLEAGGRARARKLVLE